MNARTALQAARTFATGLIVTAAAVTCTASVSVNQAAAGGHGDKSSQVQAKKEYKQGSTPDVVMAKKEYKQLTTPSAPGE